MFPTIRAIGESSIRADCARELVPGITATVDASLHWQDAAELPAKFRMREQVNALEKPARLVGESKDTTMEPPSLLNVADLSCGAAGMDRLLSTVTVLLAENVDE